MIRPFTQSAALLGTPQNIRPTKPAAVTQGGLNDDIDASSHCLDRSANSIFVGAIGQIFDTEAAIGN